MSGEKSNFYEFHVSDNSIDDTFVGIKSDGSKIRVCFPLGYSLGSNEESKKEDAKLLIKVLARFGSKVQNIFPQCHEKEIKHSKFPIHAYLNIMEDYLVRGYYMENKNIYASNQQGKINWHMTINKQNALPQDGTFFYLNFISKRSIFNSSGLITKINEYCVEESYKKIGWIFCPYIPKKSSIVFQEKEFIDLINKKLSQTSKDRDRKLFLSMRDMIKFIGREGENFKFYFGTNKFEYVWEKLIDNSFGIKNKSYYFPHTNWYLKKFRIHNQSALEPDTIMLSDKKVFILDAKYYKYGITGNPKDLPRSTSINKQITYGEFIATESKFKTLDKKSPIVFNAFIMPFDKCKNPFKTSDNMFYIGEARGDWKSFGINYERVQGILLDVKWLMNKAGNKSSKDICKLADFIEENSKISYI